MRFMHAMAAFLNRQELQDYFNEKNWYEENDDFKDEDLSKKEAENTKFIAAYQKDNDLEYKPAK